MKKTLKNGAPYASDKVGFGIYHFAQGGMDAKRFSDSEAFPYDGADRKQCDHQEKLDYMNFYVYRLEKQNYEHLRRIKEMGCVTWVFYEPFVRVEIEGKKQCHLKSGWREEITALVNGVKEAGLWDVVAGFQYDEPLSKVTADVFEEFTKYMTKFGKRQMSIFSVYEIRGTYPQASDPEFGVEFHVITPSCCQYLTDVGFDWYSHTDYDRFKALIDEMMVGIGRNDVYLWFLPATWTYYNRKEFCSEDFCLAHLEVCYRLLKNCENPGGLFCYTWRSWKNLGEGLDVLFSTSNPQRYARLEQRMIEIGRELREIPLKPLI